MMTERARKLALTQTQESRHYDGGYPTATIDGEITPSCLIVSTSGHR